MAKQLRKTLEIPLPDGDTAAVDVNFRIIEIVERVYNSSADVVASVDLASPRSMLRSKIAAVIVDWLTTTEVDFKRSELREHIITAEPKLLNVYSGCIQAAVLYSLKYIDEEQFDLLSKGKDLPTKKAEGSGGKKESVPTASSSSATE